MKIPETQTGLKVAANDNHTEGKRQNVKQEKVVPSR